MQLATPQSGEELAEILASSASGGRTVNVGGHFSKNRMGGPVHQADTVVTTSRMTRVLQYEPRDLTISVEAGMRFSDLSRLLSQNNQMIPLDPAWAESATIGGVLATNTSGPRRRLYGTARDLVIGLRFATLEGKLVQSGGMVVKNVAGLDMAKLLIGSYGTLAVMAVVNLKLVPKPPRSKTYLFHLPNAAVSAERCEALLKSVLQPAAVDLFNPAASAFLGYGSAWLLAVQAVGSGAVLARYDSELSGMDVLEGEPETQFWESVRELGPSLLAADPDTAIVRLPRTLILVASTLAGLSCPGWARAGSGVCYAAFATANEAAAWLKEAPERRRFAVFEMLPENQKRAVELWPDPGSEIQLMQKIKHMFDPDHLLNRGRLHGRI